MATTGLEVFDRTLHITNLWLDEINAEIGPDRHLAWHVLGAVLRSIRDEMQVVQSAHFAAQLPLLIRGAYFDQYRPSAQPAAVRSHDDFIGRIQHDLDGTRPVNVEQAAVAVMRTLNRHVTEGQVRKVRDALPKGVRAMWPEPGHQEPAPKEPAPKDPGRAAPHPAMQHAEPSRPAPQHAAPPRPAPPRAEPPHPAPPQHSASQHPADPHRSAQYEREEIPEDIDEYQEERSITSSKSSSSKGAHVPLGAASRPANVDAAPAGAQTTATRKTKARGKKQTDD